MAKITVKQLEALTAADDGKVVRDDGGLVGRVRAGVRGVTVAFRFEFKMDGRKRDCAVGSWPRRSLKELRDERDRLRAAVTQRVDPAAARAAQRIEHQKKVEATLAEEARRREEDQTVADLFKVWVTDGVSRRDGNAELRRSFGRDVLPAIGSVPVRLLTDKHLRDLLRSFIKAGNVRTAHVRYADISQMLQWAEKRQPWRRLLINGNPADLVEMAKLTPDDYRGERSRVLMPGEICELHGIFARMQAEYDAAPNKRRAARPLPRTSQLALWIALGTCCRIGEILMARWEHVDLERGEWIIPRENYKRHRGDRRGDFAVFLSDFAVRQFEELKKITGETPWCFPSRKPFADTHIDVKTVSKQVGDRQCRFKDRQALKNRRHDDSLVLSGGERGDWTPHDLRRTGSTLMQQLGVDDDTRNRCLNHAVGSRIDRVYGVHDFADEKRAAWKKLGDRLDAILAGGAQIVQLGRTAA